MDRAFAFSPGTAEPYQPLLRPRTVILITSAGDGRKPLFHRGADENGLPAVGGSVHGEGDETPFSHLRPDSIPRGHCWRLRGGHSDI